MFGNQNLGDISHALDSLSELEQNVSEAILRRRASPRVKLCTKISVQHANASQRSEMELDGLTGDISDGGCQVLLPVAILPGDIFWLDFAGGKASAIGAIFARCLRCRLVCEGTYEVGFRFFQEIDVEDALSD